VLKIITEKPDIYRNQRFQPIFLNSFSPDGDVFAYIVLYYITVRGQPAIILHLHTHNKNAVKFIR